MSESYINRCKYQIWAVIGVGWLEMHTGMQGYNVKSFRFCTPHTDRQVFALTFKQVLTGCSHHQLSLFFEVLEE